MDRRELLKYFSVGTTIVPVVNGCARVEATSKLIEVPNVEQAMPAMPGMVAAWEDFVNLNEVGMTVVFNGKKHTVAIHGRGSIQSFEFLNRQGDVTMVDPGNWRIEGVFTGPITKQRIR